LEITKTVLSLILVVIPILTTLTTTIAAYAGGENDDGGDGNKQKAEDDSSAALADCDDNEVQQARFLCIAIAASEIEPPEESATLSVCKEALGTGTEPEDFTFTVTGNNPSPAQFEGDADCVDVTIGPGEYTVSEVSNFGPNFGTTITGDCVDEDPASVVSRTATGVIDAGDTQECIFRNFFD
jgi:hypothetical protein